MKIVNLITKNHKKTKRKFIERMVDNKIEAMRVRLYEYDYWDAKEDMALVDMITSKIIDTSC